MAKAPKHIFTLTHDAAQRVNNPTAEMASLYEQQQELDRVKWKPMRIPRDRPPLAAGEVRVRDGDLDPQIALFVVGDLGQRIFRQPFSQKGLGLAGRGWLGCLGNGGVVQRCRSPSETGGTSMSLDRARLRSSNPSSLTSHEASPNRDPRSG